MTIITASNRERRHTQNRVWAIFREAGCENVSRDPLSKRYDVHKFSTHYEFDSYEQAMEVRERVLALMTIGGWIIKRSNLKKPSDFTAHTPESLCETTIGLPHELVLGEWRICGDVVGYITA